MSGVARLYVTQGLHAGASIALLNDREVVIGGDGEAGLVLVDAGVKPHHATVRLQGDRLVLRTVSDSVVVFAHTLGAGRKTLLRHGASFRIGEAALLFSNGAQMTDRDAERAELAWLFTHAPLAWLRRRCARVPRYGRVVLMFAPFALASLFVMDLLTPPTPVAQSSLLEKPAFRNVRVGTDQTTGTRLYEGYVQTPADLGALALEARAQGVAANVRVAVIDNMQEQLSDFLDLYYRGAQLSAADPGTFIATPPASAGYLQAESWDYARIARLAQSQVEGLKALRFAGHENEAGPVRVPMEALGLNLVSSPHTAWLADRQGVRYFAGARVAIGRIQRIGRCNATVIRDDGSIYDLITRTDEGKSC
ncbi:hypothetical protein AWB80_02716 [Caballeronia pedi]|uniref:YscD cytoplasmic domain-containing protein n=1 Tax=Caballeronia pedi TaxID=1777141 RepID=A0A158AXU9_9BURK|nr:FHA domain-containing protein [Caballeronia pedi]SAK61847.1 hypothetical protein AWB80_02716 [Caballeronia pedi]